MERKKLIEAIEEMLEQADEKVLRIIYTVLRAML